MLNRQAFTLIELLVVTAVVALLAAILFPIFSRAKIAAIQASCLGRFHQVTAASQIYTQDYDEYFMPVNHEPGGLPNAKTDRTWVQMLLPYTGNFKTFHCPGDEVPVDQTIGYFDQDLVPGDLFDRYYTASMHVNLGYNFQYLAPILKVGQTWTALPKNSEELADPAEMLLFTDSAWEVDNGVPTQGGSWLVSPPCRYEDVNGQVIDTIDTTTPIDVATGSIKRDTVYAPVAGWQPIDNMASMSETGAVFGGAWPWHSGRLTVATVGGSARAITIAQLGQGCQILPSWTGSIQDRSIYLWSPQ